MADRCSAEGVLNTFQFGERTQQERDARSAAFTAGNKLMDECTAARAADMARKMSPGESGETMNMRYALYFGQMRSELWHDVLQLDKQNRKK